MEQIGSNEPELTLRTQAIANNIGAEALRAYHRKPDIDPNTIYAYDLLSYQQACRELLGTTDIVSDDRIKKIIAIIQHEAKLKKMLPEGKQCLVTVIPFSNHGKPLSPQEIKGGEHVRIITIDATGKGSEEFSLMPSYISKMLPVELQSLAFDIGKYDGNGVPTDKDRQRLCSQILIALQRLRFLLNKPDNSPKQ